MEEDPISVAESTARQSWTLSSNQLTASLVLVILIPVGLVFLLYSMVPAIEDPVLDVVVRVGPRAWPSDDLSNARLMPCVIVSNPTSELWRNVNMSINDQFHFSYPEPLAAGGEMFVPLKFFRTKKGSAFFPPESQELKLLTVYAQIPSGARAIIEIDGKDLELVLSPE